MSRLEEIARVLAQADLDGWLFYDFRGSDPLARRILGLARAAGSRRWFYFLPAAQGPRALVSAVEPDGLDELPGERIVYRSAQELSAGLARMLGGARRIAMNYSPQCAIPYVSRVDAGTIEMVRGLGVEVVSAADLIQRFEATLSPGQLASHRRAAGALRQIVGETFAEIARRVAGDLPCSELAVQDFVMSRFAARGLKTFHPPIVAVNAHGANPHFPPSAEDDRRIGRGDLLVLDLWAKEAAPAAIYADLTWTAFAGERVPEEYARIFAVVAAARDAAVDLIQRRVAAGQPVHGEEADRAARAVIDQAGFGAYFVHRTGHSIGLEVHGAGANLDSLETDDRRLLIDRTCFSVEPGIYLPGRFGVRSELDMTIEDGRAEVSAAPAQSQIVALLAPGALRAEALAPGPGG